MTCATSAGAITLTLSAAPHLFPSPHPCPPRGAPLLADALPPPLPQVRNHHLPINSGCASCWAVTTASVIGDRLNMLVERSPGAGESPSPRIEVSAQYLLNCVPGQRHCGYPGSASAAMRYVATHGIPDEACAPWQVRTPRAPLGRFGSSKALTLWVYGRGRTRGRRGSRPATRCISARR